MGINEHRRADRSPRATWLQQTAPFGAEMHPPWIDDVHIQGPRLGSSPGRAHRISVLRPET